MLVGVWLGLIVLSYRFFKAFLGKFSNKVIAPDILNSDPMDRYVGHFSTVEVIEGRRMIRLDDELVTYDSETPLSPGDPVMITAMTHGRPTVSRQPSAVSRQPA